MRTRIALGLAMTLTLGALMAAPVSGEPGKGKGMATQVLRGSEVSDVCQVEAIVATLDEVEKIERYKGRFVYKQNGRPSKLFCRIRGAIINDRDVDPPAQPQGNLVRLREPKASPYCPTTSVAGKEVGTLLRARLKLNAKGNGLLKCVYEPPGA